MSHDSVRAAVGLRIKSGWATAVLLAGPVHSPQLLDRRIVGLSDPAVPESRQPYHAAMGMLEEDATKIAARLAVVQRVANRSVAEYLQHHRNTGWEPGGAGLVVGSEIDPASIKNPHIRAHALEGRLFRTVVEDALRTCGLSCSVLVERNLYSKAAAILGRSEDQLKRAVSELGRSRGVPWRGDDKMAALAAWMALASGVQRKTAAGD